MASSSVAVGQPPDPTQLDERPSGGLYWKRKTSDPARPLVWRELEI